MNVVDGLDVDADLLLPRQERRLHNAALSIFLGGSSLESIDIII